MNEIAFVSTDIDELDVEIVSTVENLLGRKLYPADPLLVFLKGLEAVIINQRALINFTARMNLLAYSRGEYLDKLGELVGCERLPAAYSVTTVEITLSAERDKATTIKKGTRITADNEIFFALDDDVIIRAGHLTATAKATCLTVGEIGNNYRAGELNKIVDPQPFLESIINTTTSALGADIESDDSYRERIRLAPESFSCAGSKGAYEYHAKSASALISDVAVTSPVPGVVDVYVLCQGGAMPELEILQAVDEKLNAKTVRPLTDTVNVKAPTVIDYSLDIRYWINEKDSADAAQIIERVNAACAEFIEWQSECLGRDINPNKLLAKLMGAGIKRAEINSPVFTRLNDFQVAKATNPNYTPVYCELEEE